jgi:hypothetical protein
MVIVIYAVAVDQAFGLVPNALFALLLSAANLSGWHLQLHHWICQREGGC